MSDDDDDDDDGDDDDDDDEQVLIKNTQSNFIFHSFIHPFIHTRFCAKTSECNWWFKSST